MKSKQEKLDKLWAEINDYLISFNLHISHKMFSHADIDRKKINKDLKKIERIAAQLGLTVKEFSFLTKKT